MQRKNVKNQPKIILTELQEAVIKKYNDNIQFLGLEIRVVLTKEGSHYLLYDNKDLHYDNKEEICLLRTSYLDYLFQVIVNKEILQDTVSKRFQEFILTLKSLAENNKLPNLDFEDHFWVLCGWNLEDYNNKIQDLGLVIKRDGNDYILYDNRTGKCPGTARGLVHILRQPNVQQQYAQPPVMQSFQQSHFVTYPIALNNCSGPDRVSYKTSQVIRRIQHSVKILKPIQQQSQDVTEIENKPNTNANDVSQSKTLHASELTWAHLFPYQEADSEHHHSPKTKSIKHWGTLDEDEPTQKKKAKTPTNN